MEKRERILIPTRIMDARNIGKKATDAAADFSTLVQCGVSTKKVLPQCLAVAVAIDQAAHLVEQASATVVKGIEEVRSEFENQSVKFNRSEIGLIA